MKIIKGRPLKARHAAFCQDCNWCDDFDNAGGHSATAVTMAAREHIKKTGHTVNIETGFIQPYGAR